MSDSLLRVVGSDPALTALASGRIGLGLLARCSPAATTTVFGAAGARSPELDYVLRVFGVRALALGTGYLLSDGQDRRLWQRLAFVCDVSDTIAGLGDVLRGEVARRSAITSVALTGGYALVGGARVTRDLRSRRRAAPDR